MYVYLYSTYIIKPYTIKNTIATVSTNIYAIGIYSLTESILSLREPRVLSIGDIKLLKEAVTSAIVVLTAVTFEELVYVLPS